MLSPPQLLDHRPENVYLKALKRYRATLSRIRVNEFSMSRARPRNRRARPGERTERLDPLGLRVRVARVSDLERSGRRRRAGPRARPRGARTRRGAPTRAGEGA